MKLLRLLIFYIFLYIRESSQLANDTHYVAAVVEFYGLYEQGLTVEQMVNNNSKAYQEIILSEEVKPAEIIVFPEMTLNGFNRPLTYVPKPDFKVSPCDSPSKYENFFVEISCRAKEAKKYVVINLAEKEDCTTESQAAIKDPRPCARNGLNVFNTNVVFDRSGVVIATYRKVHLFGEYNKNTTYVPEHSSFTTDFGVTFGIFTCFDINFETPTQDLVRRGITDFVYPTMWIAELPFLTAVQTQMAWAYGNDVNLLAANAGQPAGGSTGTGIFAGKDGLITAAVHNDPVRAVYVGAVPKIINGKRSSKPVVIPPTGAKSTDNMFIMVDHTIPRFTTEVISSSENGPQSFNVCSNGFCCDFNVTKKALKLNAYEKAYEFRVGAFNDFRSFSGIEDTYLRICGVFACTNSSVTTCGAIFNSKQGVPVSDYFENIDIKANLPKKEKMLIQPTSAYRNLLSIPADEFDFKVEQKSSFYEISLSTNKRTDLLAFAIFTNYYDNSVSAAVSSMFVILVSFMITKLF